MTILRTENITKSYNDKTVIEDINIHLKEGELVSLLGVSGSGKTTLFNIISGLIMPDEGSVQLSDRDITGKPGSVAYMLQKDIYRDAPIIGVAVTKEEAYVYAEEHAFGLQPSLSPNKEGFFSSL